MTKVWATLRTFGVLLGLWVILGTVGILTGVVRLDELTPHVRPRPSGDVAEEADDTGTDTSLPDAGTAEQLASSPSGAGDAGTGPIAAAPDAGSEPAVTPVTRASRWSVCASSPAEPSLVVAQVFGDPRPEVIVGCPDGWHVVGLGAWGPARVALFTTGPAPSGQLNRTGPAAAGDVDGDGHPDLVLPLARETREGAGRGGRLHWVPRGAYGGVRDPVALAPIAAVDATIAPLDANPGADIVAMNRTNALAQLPSEAWVFGGGAAPARQAALVTGLSGIAARVGDLDRDGHADVVTLARGRLDLHFGDGHGTFERTHTFELNGARELALGDLDGDGGSDLVVLGDGLRWIRAGSLEGMEPRGVDGVPATLRGLQILDVNGDGKLDFVGWDHPRLVVLEHRDEVDFRPYTALTLTGGPFGPRRHQLADLDADGAADDLVLLGTTAGEDAALEILLVTDALEGAELQPSEEVRALPDAPLILEAALR